MRKNILAVLLLAALLCQLLPFGAAAAFADISDPAASQAASVLNGMGIVDGVGENKFSPDTVLTRAQFCALVVRMMGMTEQVSGNSYKMLFTDAKPGKWFTGYVNLAYSEGLVSGYGNGKFGPDDPATYGQVATIVLRLLGYTAQDVGNVWPTDYVNFANDLGLGKGLQLTGGAITRGQAAVVLYNTLLAVSKTTGREYYRAANGAVSAQKALVLDLSAENGGAKDQLMVCTGGTVAYYGQKHKVSSDFLGEMGQVLLNAENRVVGFIPTDEKWVEVTADAVKATSVTGTDGKVYAVAADAVTLVGKNVYPWGTAGYLQAAAQTGKLRLYYDEKGAVSHVQVCAVGAEETVTQVVKSQRAIVLDVDVDNGNTSDLLMAYTIGAAGSMEYYGQRKVLPAEYVGCIGDLLLDEENCVVGFSKAAESMKDVVVKEAKATGIVGTDGVTYRITGSAVTIVGDELYTWKETGYLLLDSRPGKTVKLYYDEIGAVTHVYLNQGTATAATVTAVAQSGASAADLAAKLGIEGSYLITKNGVKAENADIAKGDVAYFDSASATLRVSDHKVTGMIDAAYPGVIGAETLTIAGCAIEVMESAWESLENFTLGDGVTLHLTDDGKAAYASVPTERSMLGLLSTDGRTVTLCGSGLQMNVTATVVGSEKLCGGLVTVSDGVDAMRYYAYTAPKENLALDIAAGTLGKYKLAPSCEIYENATTTGYSSYACSLSGEVGKPSYDFRELAWTQTLPASAVSAYHLNSAGQVDVLLLCDVTGNCYEYGKLAFYSGAISMGNMGGMSAKNSAITVTNGNYPLESAKYLSGNYTTAYDAYHGIALRTYNNNYKMVTSTVTLTRKAQLHAGNFTLEADRWYCTVGENKIPVSKNVQILLEKSGSWLCGEANLRAVLATSSYMTVHYDRTPTTGAQVRVLVVTEHA